MSSVTDHDPEALLDAVAKKRRRKPAAQAAGNAAAGSARRRKQAAAKPKVEPITIDDDDDQRRGSDPWNGQGADGPRPWRFGWRECVAMVAVTLLVAVTVVAWRQAPPEPTGTMLIPPDGIPRRLMAQWIRGFPDYQRLFVRPDADTLEALAAYIQSLPSVAKVHSVRLEHRGDGEGPPLAIQFELDVNRPVLPVMLQTGQRAWLGADGQILPGILPGPEGLPVVRGIEGAGPAAIDELLAVWPELGPRLEAVQPGLVTGIRCDVPLAGTDQRGIAFLTAPGTVLTWGAPGEHIYGVDRQTRIRNLVHTVRCQGDLALVPEINVRFHEPFAVLRVD